MSPLAPFSRLAQVSEFSLSAKLALSLEGDKRLAERANDALSACLHDIFSSRFLLSTKRVDASLSGWHSLSALSSLSETSTLALLQSNSFLPEIEEKLTLISCTRLLLSTNKNKAKFIYNPTKRIINWGKYIHFVKNFYTKVSRIRRLINSPNLQFCLSSSKERTTHLCSSDKITVVIHKVFALKNSITWNEWNTMLQSTASHKTCNFSKMWTWLLRNTTEIS